MDGHAQSLRNSIIIKGGLVRATLYNPQEVCVDRQSPTQKIFRIPFYLILILLYSLLQFQNSF